MPKVTLQSFETYIALIKGAVGTEMFRHVYGTVDGKNRDLTQNGNLSCAYFPSFVLKHFDLIQESHVTVSGLVRDLEKSGWKKVARPEPGCILIWDAMDDKKDKNFSFGHEHVGFYVGKGKAISNLSSKKTPGQHNWTFGVKNGRPKRSIKAMYWHRRLDG